MSLIWQIFLVFAPLSLITVGGGQSAIADIHRQVVDVHHWLSETQFVNDFAISRMAPGPGSLLACLIGWQVAGIGGAVAAGLGIFGPTSLLIYGVAHLWARFKGARILLALEAGLRPVAAGMLLSAVWILLQALEGGWLAQGLALASAAALFYTRLNPLLLIAIGAAIFLALGTAGTLQPV
ncbi:chromate transporter [Consotaella aegiceratis]|uniref:chromate transporter n=1 Tax=Consotaella aegiceratis TaxID=3097961 RepID=UPI002F3F896F